MLEARLDKVQHLTSHVSNASVNVSKVSSLSGLCVFRSGYQHDVESQLLHNLADEHVNTCTF